MSAVPPPNDDQPATSADPHARDSGLRVEMAGFRVEMAGFRGDSKAGLAFNLRVMLAAQLATTVILGAWISAVT